MRAAAALAIVTVSLAVCVPARADLVRGFVVGHLLKTWCTRDTPVDREACYSYLRGVFDTLNAMIIEDQPGAGENPGAVRCIPERVSVTELRTIVLRYMDARPEELSVQAAKLTVDSWLDNYSGGC